MKGLFIVVVALSVGGICLGASGDMGLGTEPLTDGSVDYPYLIEDVNDFDVFAGDPSYWASGVYTRLACDLNLAGRTYTTAVIAPDTPDTSNSFDGIPFQGIFDGDGHAVSNLTIYGTYGRSYFGLFGNVDGASAEVKNLKIINSNINAANRGYYSGGLCGYNSGNITNCSATGSFTVQDGGFMDPLNSHGGLCGANDGIISNSYATVSLTGGENVQGLGGLCGYNHSPGTINNCYSTGSVEGGYDLDHSGGLCGWNWGTISNCYSTGSVIGGSYSWELGGLCGSNDGTISNCFWDIDTSGMTSSDGGTGKTTLEMHDPDTFLNAGWDFVSVWGMPSIGSYPFLLWEEVNIGLSANEFFFVTHLGDPVPADQTLFVFNAGSDVLNWQIDYDCSWLDVSPLLGSYSGDPNIVTLSVDHSGLSSGLYECTLTVSDSANNDPNNTQMVDVSLYVTLAGSGSSEDPYLIENINDFDVFAGDPSYWAGGVHTTLAFDPNLAGRTYTNAVIAPDTSTSSGFQGTSFNGVFDGNDFTIINLTINTLGADDDYLGLFGRTDSNSVIVNVGIENCAVGGQVSDYIGGLVAKNLGTITDCYFSDYVRGGFESRYVGGLAGYNSGIITNCYSTGQAKGWTDSWWVGGLVGYNDGTITDCHSTCDVLAREQAYDIGGLVGRSNGMITHCFARGSVRGDGESADYVGGLVGRNAAPIIGCYSTGDVVGGSWSWFIGGLAGRNYSSITDSYSKSRVSGSSYAGDVGGLVGINSGSIARCYSTGQVLCISYCGGSGGFCSSNSGTITASFWDYETSGKSYSDGGSLSSTYDMQKKSTFTYAGWDFVGESVNGPEDIWRMCVDGITYPRLWWEFAAGDFACPDGVDLVDFAILAKTWFLSDGETGYNDRCDTLDDDTIDFGDLAIFNSCWLEGATP